MRRGFLDRPRARSDAARPHSQSQPDAQSQVLQARLAEAHPAAVQSGEAAAAATDDGTTSGGESEDEQELSGSKLGRQEYWVTTLCGHH